MKPSANGELKPVPLVGQAPGYPAEIVQRALELVEERGVMFQGYKALVREMADQGLVAPDYSTVWHWVREREDVMSRIQATEKREMVGLSQEVAVAASGRMLEALPELSHSQIPVAYGIAMQRRTDWENAGSKAPQMAVQFNFVRRGQDD